MAPNLTSTKTKENYGSTVTDIPIYHTGTEGQVRPGDVAASDLRVVCGTAKTLVLDTPVYNDLNAGFSAAKVPAVNAPTWAAMVGNLNAYTFAVNDYLEVAAQEFLHDWNEGTAVEVHIHWATNGANDATARGVKWEVEYAWANYESAGGTIVFAAATLTQASDTVIAASEPSLTHKYSSIGSFTPTGGKIGAYLLLRVKRIAASGTAPVGNPFGLAVGVHYQIDTLGSRSTAGK